MIYYGRSPEVLVSHEANSAIRNVFLLAKSKVTLFLYADIKDGLFTVYGCDIPNQKADKAKTIIAEDDLYELGEYYYGAAIYDDYDASFTKDDIEYVRTISTGIKRFVALKYNQYGEVKATVVYGNMVFDNIEAEIEIFITKQEEVEVLTALKNKTASWVYKDGIKQLPRKKYKKSALLEENRNWETVV